jgi:hypothetical protein
MNTDCFAMVTKFLPFAEATKINVESAVQNFPKKVVLRSFVEVEKFIQWCQTFNPINLEEVTYCIYDMRYDAPRGQLVGWVPPGVKVLRVDVYNYDVLYAEIPESVEELHLERISKGRIVFPPWIKRVTLGKKFNGIILEWPESMEELNIQGWDSCDYNGPHCIDNLPEGLRTMHLSWGVPVEVRKWPTTLEKLTIEESDEDCLVQWIGIQHEEVPKSVDFTLVKIPHMYW